MMSLVFRPFMRRPVASWLSGIVWIAAVIGPCDVPSARGREHVTLQRGMVVAVSAPAAEVGAEVLKQGGNAVDAAVATALALAVTYPPAGNIGGGGFMMILPRPGTRPVCIDYRETAPAAATRTMFADETGRYGPRVVGVPGTVRGLTLAHRTYGSLPWAEVVRPAIRWAREGFEVDRSLAQSLNKILTDEDSALFEEMRRVYAPPDGDSWKPRDALLQPDLARTLEIIAAEGDRGFYHGPVAAAIVAEMERGCGLISRADLEAYEARERPAVHGTYRGFDVYGPPPPSSGGIVLVQMLNLLEQFDVRSLGRDTPATAHLMIETMRRAYLDRARYLGDSDFVPVPDFLTTKAYAAQLAREIDPERATCSEDLAPEILVSQEEPSTTHFSVVDSRGMAVSNTYTLEQSYGSRVMVRGHGFLLNNQMGDFNWNPGRTDRRGGIGTPPNQIEPGKRMLSSQTPVLVLKDGDPFLITGSPGGRTIINTVLCVLVNVLDFDVDLPSAVAAPRWHHQWLPNTVRFEGARDPRYRSLVEQLHRMGHAIDRETGRQGDAHSILVDPRTGAVTGVADRRISGSVAATE